MGQLLTPAESAKPGTIAYFAGDTPPAGWLACDGAVVSRSTYAALFAAIGTTYGDGTPGGNLIVKSSEFDDAAWTKQNSTIATPNVGPAPNGELIADLYSSTGAFHAITHAVGIAANTNFNVGISLKRIAGAGGNVAKMWLVAGGSYTGVMANIGAGTVTPFGNNAGNTPAAENCFLELEPEGFARFGFASNEPNNYTEIRIVPGDSALSGAYGSFSNELWHMAGAYAGPGLVIGDFWGGSSFALPDLRGEFVRGFDGGRGVDSGRVFGSAQEDEIKSHTHAVATGQNTNFNVQRVAQSDASNESTLASTAAGGTETRPRNVAMLPCIKY